MGALAPRRIAPPRLGHTYACLLGPFAQPLSHPAASSTSHLATYLSPQHHGARRYKTEALHAGILVPTALLLMGESSLLRDFMTNSLHGVLLEDESVRGAAGTLADAFPISDDGHCLYKVDSVVLQVRAVAALLDDPSDASRAALREWLPPAAELSHIAEFELWLRSIIGSHPSLLCARLHGERLGDWTAAAEVAEFVLAVESFNPAVRTEAHRLLGRARAALGQHLAAREAAEAAIDEAAKAKYVWLEMLALRDLLEWSEVGEVESVRARLGGVLRRVATAEELDGVLGEGDWAGVRAMAEQACEGAHHQQRG